MNTNKQFIENIINVAYAEKNSRTSSFFFGVYKDWRVIILTHFR